MEMDNRTILDYSKDPVKFDELRQLILSGSGSRDIHDRENVNDMGQTKGTFLEYELKVEEKHAGILVPFMERFVSLDSLSVLDFGSGTGGSGVAMAARGAFVTGVEVSELNIRAAFVRAEMYGLKNIRFVHHEDTLHLPFENDVFDICVANSVLEYIYHGRSGYIREIWRVLKPGGILFITDTSNGIYPFELHSRRWWINYFPGKAEELKCVTGLTYFQIKKALKKHSCSNLNMLPCYGSFRDYYFGKGRPSSFKRRLLYVFWRVVEIVICRPFGIPVEAFLPWLNIVMKKDKA